MRGLERTAWPVLDLVVRLSLAKAYLASGLVKVMNWQTALFLASDEYPVRWLSPLAAAYLGASIEIAGSLHMGTVCEALDVDLALLPRIVSSDPTKMTSIPGRRTREGLQYCEVPMSAASQN